MFIYKFHLSNADLLRCEDLNINKYELCILGKLLDLGKSFDELSNNVIFVQLKLTFHYSCW